MVRAIETNGTISLVAGGPETIGGPGQPGHRYGNSGNGGPAIDARLGTPVGLTIDPAGNLYVLDDYDLVVRKIDPGGTISASAGNGIQCNAVPCAYLGDNGPATQAGFVVPDGLAADRAGNYYIVDDGHNRIRKVDTAGMITTVVGSGAVGFSGDGGPAIDAALILDDAYVNGTYGSVAIDSSGNLYFTDYGNRRIRRVDTNGIITTIAGNGSTGVSGDGGPAVFAGISAPTGIALDSVGNVYFRDSGYVRKIQRAQTAIDFGNVPLGQSVTRGVYLSINTGLSLASAQTTGDFSVQSSSCAPLTTLAAGTICTLQVTFAPTQPATRTGRLTVAEPNGTSYLFTLTGTGKGTTIAFTPGILKTVAGTGGQAHGGDGGPATATQVFSPAGMRVDVAGNLYFAESGSCSIRRIDTRGIITTVAGTGACSKNLGGPSGDGSPATSVALGGVMNVAVDPQGAIYIPDFLNHRVRKVFPNGTITTVAGIGTPGFSGDGQAATQAQLHTPIDVALDRMGNLYIADEDNERVRKVDGGGVITTVAGTGVDPQGVVGALGPDGGAATASPLNVPYALAFDPAGNLYVAEFRGNRIRKIDSNSGIISTVAGTGGAYTPPPIPDNVTATDAIVEDPSSLAFDPVGNLYIANYGAWQVDRVDPFGTFTRVGGNGVVAASPDGSPATTSPLYLPQAVVTDGHGNLYVSELNGNRIRRIDTGSSAISLDTPVPTSVGTAGSIGSVRVTNTGNQDLIINQFGYPSGFGPAQVGSDCIAGSAVPPGASCNIGVQFVPRYAGEVTGTLLVFDNAVNAPHSVTLSGNAQGTVPAATAVVDAQVLHGSQATSLLGLNRIDLPWQITGIRIVFSAPVVNGDIESLIGIGATTLSGLGTNTLTWNFPPPSLGAVSLSLVTTGTYALLDASSNPVAPNTTDFQVLPGDANGDGAVTSADLVVVGNGRVGPYNPFNDLNSDGVVDVQDIQIVRDHLGATLP